MGGATPPSVQQTISAVSMYYVRRADFLIHWHTSPTGSYPAFRQISRRYWVSCSGIIKPYPSPTVKTDALNCE